MLQFGCKDKEKEAERGKRMKKNASENQITDKKLYLCAELYNYSFYIPSLWTG